MNRPIIHVLNYAEPGAGKSTFAATFPKPMLVFMFDPYGKEMPYLRQGKNRIEAYTSNGVRVQSVNNEEGNVLVQVEHYIDPEPERPLAYRLFKERLSSLHREYANWATVVIDSVTYLEITARYEQQFHLNPASKDPRQWWSGATDQIEQVLMIRFGSLPMNVVVLAHVDSDKDELHGMFVRNPAAPGRMRTRLASGYGEFYHSVILRDEQSNTTYALQTQGDHIWNASSQIQAPNPCYAHYDFLWDNWDKEHA